MRGGVHRRGSRVRRITPSGRRKVDRSDRRVRHPPSTVPRSTELDGFPLALPPVAVEPQDRHDDDAQEGRWQDDTRESILSMLKALVRMPRRTKPMVDLMAPPTPPATDVPPTTTAHTTNNGGSAGDRARRAELRCQHHAAEGGCQAADEVCRRLRSLDVDARVLRDFVVAADGVYVPAERCAPQHPVDDGHHGEHHDDEDGHRAEDLGVRDVLEVRRLLDTGWAFVSCCPTPVSTIPIPRVMMNGSVRW